jgi:hypothetical protein
MVFKASLSWTTTPRAAMTSNIPPSAAARRVEPTKHLFTDMELLGQKLFGARVIEAIQRSLFAMSFGTFSTNGPATSSSVNVYLMTTGAASLS